MDLQQLEPLVPQKQKPGVRVLYGTVTQASPLKVLVDGDTSAVDVNAACTPLVGERVLMVLQDRVLTAVSVVSPDTGWLTGVTSASGWDASAVTFRRVGCICSIFGGVDRTGAAITVPANGNITNQHVATLPEAFWPAQNQALTCAAGGALASWYIEAGNGKLYLAAVESGLGTIAMSSLLSVGGTYLLG